MRPVVCDKLCTYSAIPRIASKMLCKEMWRDILKTIDKLKWNYKSVQVTHRKAGKRKQRIVLGDPQGSSHKAFNWLLKGSFAGWKELARHKSRNLQPRLLYPAKLTLKSRRADKELPRQGKTKGVHCHQTIIKWNVKGT